MGERAIKKLIIWPLLAAALVAGWFLAMPYWTLWQMKSALDDEDYERFSEYVDYRALSINISNQIVELAPRSENEGFAGLIIRSFAASWGSDRLERILTPRTTAMLLSGSRLVAPSDADPQATSDLLGRAGVRMNNFSGFSITIDGEPRARFQWRGLGYRLTSIELPDDPQPVLDWLKRQAD